MLAAIFKENGGPDVITVEEVDTPIPGPGEARIHVEASALNHLDLWLRRGLPIETPMPHIGGSDIAGTVDQVGTGVDPGLVGMRVVVDPSLHYDWYELARLDGASPSFSILGEHTQGGFAEYAVAPAQNLVPLPDHVSADTAAAAALTGVTAWHGLMARGGLRAGQRVLITGASGGVSTMAIQFAVRAGAEVHALTSTQHLERVEALGAHHVYDRAESEWSKAVYRATGKRGVDLCLDSVGEALWPSAVRCLAVGGKLVSFGATTGPQGTIDIRLLFWRQLSILGSTMGTPAEFRDAMGLVFRGDVAPQIDRVLPLVEAREAHELLEAGGVFGKIVLRP